MLRIFRKTFLRVANFSANLIPLMWVLAVGISLIEAFFYPGFILKHTSLNPIPIYVAFLLLGLVELLSRRSTKKILPSLTNRLSYYAIFLFGLAFFVFYLLDTFKYANFTFSTFHFHTLQLTVPLALSVYMYLVSSKNNLLDIFGKTKSTYKLKFLLAAVLLWIIVPNTIDLIKLNVLNLSFLFKNPASSYDNKMEEKVGKLFYDYVMFLKKNTPENSKILLPPFPRPLAAYPWPQTGNDIYMRYFLYPRVLLNGEEYSPKYDLKKEDIDYVLIAWGETESTSGNYTHGWPKFDVHAEKILFLTVDGKTEEFKGDYIFNTEDGEQWGLIKVAK